MSAELLKELKASIAEELDLCRSAETPYICGNLQTGDGRRAIEAQILQRVLHEKISISAAIVAMEQELNPHSYEQ